MIKKKVFLDPKLGPREVSEEITKQVILEELYLVARLMFKCEEYVSPASLQRRLQIPYYLARAILNKMIAEGFCETQIGALPCKIIKIIGFN